MVPPMRRQSALPGQLGLGGRPGQRGGRGGSRGRDSGAVIVVAVAAAAAVMTVPMVVSVVPKLLDQVQSQNGVVIIVAFFDPVHRPLFAGLQRRHLNCRHLRVGEPSQP